MHVDEHGFWVLSSGDVYAIAIGAGILGTGGGGNAFRPALAIRKHLEKHPELTLRVRPMCTLPDDAVILSGGIIGAPVVGTEKSLRPERASAMDECCARSTLTYHARIASAVASAGSIGGSSWCTLVAAAADA